MTARADPPQARTADAARATHSTPGRSAPHRSNVMMQFSFMIRRRRTPPPRMAESDRFSKRRGPARVRDQETTAPRPRSGGDGLAFLTPHRVRQSTTGFILLRCYQLL